MNFKIFSKFLFFILLIGDILSVDGGPDHKKLLNYLFKNYDIHERPVQNENDTVYVRFGVTLLGLTDVNIVRGYLETNLWLTLEWNDVNLKWDPSQHGGITTLSIPSTRIWKPDILMYNGVHSNFDPTHPTNVVVKEDGNVTYIPPGIFRSSCATSVRNYPYDEHSCTLKFGSWTLDGQKLNLKLVSEEGDLASFTNHYEWEILGFPGKLNSIHYACCTEPYMDITYILQLKRRGGAIFSGCSFALFLGTVSILLCSIFPIKSGQRVNLGVLCLLGLLLMGTSIHNQLGGKYSILVCYFRTLAFMAFTSIISNVFVLFFYNRNPSLHKMPYYIQRIFCEKIPNFILLNRPFKNISCRVGSISRDSGNISNPIESNEQYDELLTDLQVLIQKFSGNNSSGHGQEEQESQFINDWQYLAIVMDRLTLIIFTTSILIFFFALFCEFV